MDRFRLRARPFLACAKRWLTARWLLLAAALASATPAAAQQARITNLNNLAFGTASFTADVTKTDPVCVYSSTTNKTYTVLASGSGTNGAFTMTAGSASLPYDVEWADTTGQTSGVALTSGTTSPTFASTATVSGCTSGPTTSATLIVRLRATQASVATAGSYSGTLTVTITPQ